MKRKNNKITKEQSLRIKNKFCEEHISVLSCFHKETEDLSVDFDLLTINGLCEDDDCEYCPEIKIIINDETIKRN